MIAIVKYNAGNIRSVQNALAGLGYESRVTGNRQEILRADKVILPGVGEASSAMQYLQEKGLDKTLRGLDQPMLGICLGLQLMCRQSAEGNTPGLGIFNANVKKFPPAARVPHTGWNNAGQLRGPLFAGIAPTADMYYVHSYYAAITGQTVAVCDYITPFSAALQHNNFFATQFHPEKSAAAGRQLLKNFLSL